MAIYLVDYENVYIEGLSGLDVLEETDTVHIFYTQNRCGLTFALHKQLMECRAKVELNEVAAGLKNGDSVKNALDMQLMMFTGYLIGKHRDAALYIVSKDKDFLLGTSFLEQFLSDADVSLQLVPSIAASRIVPEEEPEVPAACETAAPEEVSAPASFAQICEKYAKLVEDVTPTIPVLSVVEEQSAEETGSMFTVQYYNTVRNLLGKETDELTVNSVCEMICTSESLVAFNNALTQYYRDSKKAGSIYHKFKPKFQNLRHLSKTSRRGQ